MLTDNSGNLIHFCLQTLVKLLVKNRSLRIHLFDQRHIGSNFQMHQTLGGFHSSWQVKNIKIIMKIIVDLEAKQILVWVQARGRAEHYNLTFKFLVSFSLKWNCKGGKNAYMQKLPLPVNLILLFVVCYSEISPKLLYMYLNSISLHSFIYLILSHCIPSFFSNLN